MSVTELKPNCRCWCWWMSRILLYKGKTNDGLYRFEDFGDALFCLTEAQVSKLSLYRK